MQVRYNPRMDNIIVSDEYDGRNRKGKMKICPQCNEKFWVPLHRYEDRKVCSRECRDESRRTRKTVSCAHCGKSISRKPSKIAASKSGLQFCDRVCKENAQRIGDNSIAEIQPSHYGTAAAKTMTKKEILSQTSGHTLIREDSRKIYKREFPGHMKCQVCGYDYCVEVCHMVSVNEFPDSTLVSEINNIDNLVALCPNHHKELDGGKLERWLRGRKQRFAKS